LTLGNDVIQFVTVIRGLSVYLNAELSIKEHISRIVGSCFFQLKRLRLIRRSAGEEVIKRQFAAPMPSQFDYCNAALAGLHDSTIMIQRTERTARLITNSSSDAFTIGSDKIAF